MKRFQPHFRRRLPAPWLTPARPRLPWPVLRAALVAVLLALTLATASVVWTRLASSGHRYDLSSAPSAPVAIVFGAQVDTPFLTGRLDATVSLFRAGKVNAILVSGNASGSSGNETSAMTSYLLAHGVPPSSLLVDPLGLTTYDTCARAAQVFHLQHVLLVTQPYHLPRAVTLCRHLGLSADGIAAPCSCSPVLLFRNQFRELFAAVLALRDSLWPRPPASS
ncbi:SanA/YdcF family protein [Kutzneria chonburiensis]|uniref:Vancomycin high temperature exclusion protein n=1 Tax=Kutzneria chonburiensis TaxID=1483604 RepID=A0ABV6MRX4_9PSEU|nr:ElyC/SanA/YdcF family protein [Kutzneria chonburiensis]